VPDPNPPPSDDVRTRMQSRPPGPAEPTPHPRADIALIPPPNPSRRLGHYQLSEALGEGGMGTVWLAEDEHLHRKAAVKVMKPEYARDPVARERFTREARAMAVVRSDHVVTVYGVGEQDGIPYLAMELLPGRPLDKWLERHPQPKIAAVVQIGREAAQGLAAAHAKGLIHRDVKPSNLWLEAPTGRVKVLDFGLARSTQDDVRLTATGHPYGTPAYMSPEQARGEKLDHRSDLFSLGIVLYEMAAGRHPFPGDTPFTVMSAICNDQPAPVRELSPQVPEALAALIQQMLAKRPEDRPAGAEEVATALRSVKGGPEAAAGGRPSPAGVTQSRPDAGDPPCG
jgi:eukaryotic-like serine/threonine-protein kinase